MTRGKHKANPFYIEKASSTNKSKLFFLKIPQIITNLFESIQSRFWKFLTVRLMQLRNLDYF